jgi:glycosyltransferase involved in cell wall biosynthesis
MNVLIIGTTDILGGAAKVSWDIKSSLEADGHSVSMFVADKRSDDPNVHVIARPWYQKYLSIFLASERYIQTDWILETDAFKQADVVHCHNLHGRFFNLETLQKMSVLKPVVWTLHDEWALTPHCAYTMEGTEIRNGLYVCPSIDIQPRLLWDNTKRLIQWKNTLYNNAKLTVVTPSLWLKARAEQSTLKSQHNVHIPNGIDTSVFIQSDKATAREKLHLPQDKKIILFLATAGKANTWKGWTHVEKVIEANNDDASVLFLNVGNLVKEDAEANIEYRMQVSSPEELALYYSAADILLFTSIAENFPLVILEAMSCGLPIVSFDVGGVKEAVEHMQHGYIAPYTDTNALQEGVAWALNMSSQERDDLSKASTAKVRQFYSTEHMTTAYKKLYTDIKNQS